MDMYCIRIARRGIRWTTCTAALCPGEVSDGQHVLQPYGQVSDGQHVLQPYGQVRYLMDNMYCIHMAR